MLRNKELLVIIPAREGSKGIKKKNFIKIKKKTLLQRTIEIANNSRYVDRVILSTDSKKYFNLSKKQKVNSAVKRPHHLSDDFTSIFDVIQHEVKVNNLANKNLYLLLLQPTSPFRSLFLLNNFLKNFESKKKYYSAVSVSTLDEMHPHKIQKINKKNNLVSFITGKNPSVPRQLLPKLYKLNGMFYLANLGFILKKKTFFSKKTMPYIIDNPKSLNLDNFNDLILMKHYAKKIL
jgi:CMP-N-acetylneuraminic acid synthetase